MLEDLGNCVKIHNTVIPAANIQVEGYPSVYNGTWYPIYFEVLFENGDLWVVESNRETITIVEYNEWGQDKQYAEDTKVTFVFLKWEAFVEFYESQLLIVDLYRSAIWKEPLEV